jgi:AcrR family transcriptional regulator
LRITREAKEDTLKRIRKAAAQLFRANGFEGTTTREIAKAAGIAAGTLFNYFPSKEAIANGFLHEALARGASDYDRRRRGDESLEEDLFLYIISDLRQLKPHRQLVPILLETALSPVVVNEAQQVQASQLEKIERLLHTHTAVEPTTITLHLYWTLYTGVLSFWVKDSSRNQEDTLALVDQALKMFVAAQPTHGDGA